MVLCKIDWGERVYWEVVVVFVMWIVVCVFDDGMKNKNGCEYYVCDCVQ